MIESVRRQSTPYIPVFINIATLLVVFFLFRLALSLYFWNRVEDHTEFFTSCFIGLKFDLIIIAWLSLVPIIAISLASDVNRSGFRKFLNIYFCSCLAMVVFLEVASFAFIEEYDLRPNRLMLEYLNHPVEVMSTIWSVDKLSLLMALILVSLSAVLFTMLFKRTQLSSPRWVPARIGVGIVLLFGCALAIRGFKLNGQPPSPSDAAFSNDHFVNELTLNSPFSLLMAAYALSFEHNEKVPTIAHFSSKDLIKYVLSKSTIAPDEMIAHRNPLMHRVKPSIKRDRPMNFVIVLEESMGAEFVGSLGGKDLTPNFDRLTKQGLLFSHLYSTGTRSARGIEAILSGYLPTQSMSVIKLGLAQSKFFTAASALNSQGYRTSFIYGGNSRFDNMRKFAYGNGFDEVLDERDYKECGFKGIWGCSDEDLFAKADEWFQSQGDRPFFSMVFTSSNHGPFGFPDGRIELFEEPKGTVNNAVKYADYALGRFFDLAKTRDYFKNTVFLVVADHNWKSYGPDLVPIEKMRIPGLIMGPGIKPVVYSKPASQIDMLATVFPLLGIEANIPVIGHDINRLPADYPGRAILQYDRYHAYLLGDKVSIHYPDTAPRTFKYEDLRMEKMALDLDLEKEAAAHLLLPTYLYENRLYPPFNLNLVGIRE